MLGWVTPVEFLELYVLDLIVFVLLVPGTYRLTLRTVKHQVPASLDAVESGDTAGSADDDATDSTSER